MQGIEPQPDDSRDYTPEILYEDNHLIVVNKPAGMLTQGDASGRVPLLEHLKGYIKRRDHKPGNVFLGMVQRLDRQVSGVIVFAKTSKGAKRISEQIRERRVLKYYIAVTETAGEASGVAGERAGWRELSNHLKRSGSRTLVCGSDDPGAQSAVLRMKTLFSDSAGGVHLVRLITGRKHQIRAQLSARGTPIHGDGKYGSVTRTTVPRILLHSCFVRFEHPTRKNALSITCPPPPEFWSVFGDGAQQEISAHLSGALDILVSDLGPAPS